MPWWESLEVKYFFKPIDHSHEQVSSTNTLRQSQWFYLARCPSRWYVGKQRICQNLVDSKQMIAYGHLPTLYKTRLQVDMPNIQSNFIKHTPLDSRYWRCQNWDFDTCVLLTPVFESFFTVTFTISCLPETPCRCRISSRIFLVMGMRRKGPHGLRKSNVGMI